jgi:cytochrome d ubiquinol oxidase subunit I
MHTPVGFEMIDGKAHATSWLEIIFNPSMPYRLVHMMFASGLTASFLVAGVSSYRFLRGDKCASVIAALKGGVYAAAIIIPLQIFVGDMHGLNTLKYQPAKIAAMEAVWETQEGAPLLLFAFPNKEKRRNDVEIGIPKLASLILTHNLNGKIKGLNDFNGNHPPVAPVFFAFRIMVGTGILMLLISWLSAWQIKKTGVPKNWVAILLVCMTFSGWVATISGWYTTEIGRQPWLVNGLLTTATAAASNVSSSMISSTLAMYLMLYVTLICCFISVVFYLARKAVVTSSNLIKPIEGGM